MIAIDETCIKLNGQKCFLWTALDIFTKELIAWDASRGRSSLDAMLFLYKVKARCKGKLPIVLSDSAMWTVSKSKIFLEWITSWYKCYFLYNHNFFKRFFK